MGLSVLIPARNEEFVGLTVADLLRSIRGDTEIIVVLDGYDVPIPEIPEDPRVIVIRNEHPVGQRAATNQAARASSAKYVMKVDAHCAFDEGFDVKMMEAMEDDWTMMPVMRNLHVFNWLCPNGHRRYQSPSGPCLDCGEPTTKEIVWRAKTNPWSTSFCFDEEPHFKYFGAFKHRPEGQGDITETMSIQGSCFMLTREKYWDLEICDESLGSWGSQGIEVACKTWLSGGRLVVNHRTWYAHLFRTQGGDFGFPYEQSQKLVQGAKTKVRELFFDNRWPRQVRPLSWLLERFWPVPGWSEETRQKLKDWPLQRHNLTVGVLYYTDNELEEGFAQKIRDQIRLCIGNLKLVSVSLKPINFGQNIVLPLERGKLTMHKQILAGLEALDTDVVFFVEHDVLYHPSHFVFRPPRESVFYYNMNLWRVRKADGFAVRYDHKSLSQMCAYRSALLPEYRRRVERIAAEGFNNNGYEPGTRSIRRGGFSDSEAASWLSEFPSVDIRHDKNLSASKWRPEDFRSHRSCRNWMESTVGEIEGWNGLDAIIK